MANHGRLEGKICIVTGSTSGIGRGIAELFAREGASVIIAARREDEGARVVKGITDNGNVASFFQLDVTNESSWQGIIDYTLKTYKRLDVLVNNAGIGFLKPIVETTIPEWRNVMATNVESVFLGVKTAVPVMKLNGKRGGSIINISSNIVYVPSAMNGAYCTSKGAVAAFSHVAAVELAKDNIRVNIVYPGFVNTAILDVAYQKAAETGRTKEELMAMFGESNLVGRIGEPIDLAYPVLFLASDESGFVTGSDFVIDGGEVWKRGGADDALAKDAR
ncbi:MAG: glucose 1-dehydrogenase [Methanoregula sp.]|nr:glucose 1-dehydrogenase [Methanoregula sp.]